MSKKLLAGAAVTGLALGYTKSEERLLNKVDKTGEASFGDEFRYAMWHPFSYISTGKTGTEKAEQELAAKKLQEETKKTKLTNMVVYGGVGIVTLIAVFVIIF
jgi:hypothetical protein